MKTIQKRNGLSLVAIFIALMVFLSALPVQNCHANSTTPSEDIEQLIADVKDLNLQNGMLNCLDAKLDNAKRALGDLKANNDVAAINSLKAFVQVVEVQAGNNLSAGDANDLIIKAKLILEKLGFVYEGDICPICGSYIYHLPPCTGI